MKLPVNWRRRTTAIATVSLLFSTAFISGSSSASPTATPTVSACVTIKTGALRLLTKGICNKKTEKKVSLSIIGPEGAAGATGPEGAAGATGPEGAAGPAGATGAPGTNGSTVLSGTGVLTNTMGNDGDFYFNTSLKIIYGPKTGGTWPAGVSLSGAAGTPGTNGSAGATGAQGSAGATGAQGTNGSNGFVPLSTCGSAGTTLCTIGATGPGGGLIFFVDYNNQYSGFNYLEAAPADLAGTSAWSNNATVSVAGAAGWAARAVGRGQTNTTAIVTVYPTSGAAVAADAYSSPSYNSVVKSDWFLGSLGEMKLMYDNLQGLGGFGANYYWSSSETDASDAWGQYFTNGSQVDNPKASAYYVRPVRAF